MSRKIIDLTPEMQVLYNKFQDRMAQEGVDFIVTATYRPQAEQNALYNQGRTEPGNIVTWTRNSRHTERIAFDIAILKNGKITWNPADYFIVGKIAEEVGLEWGGSWLSHRDMPHLELRRK
jgi:peptidoglycan L-alanyl-D-glutamate endopeptidase CwlK